MIPLLKAWQTQLINSMTQGDPVNSPSRVVKHSYLLSNRYMYNVYMLGTWLGHILHRLIAPNRAAWKGYLLKSTLKYCTRTSIRKNTSTSFVIFWIIINYMFWSQEKLWSWFIIFYDEQLAACINISEMSKLKIYFVKFYLL